MLLNFLTLHVFYHFAITWEITNYLNNIIILQTPLWATIVSNDSRQQTDGSKVLFSNNLEKSGLSLAFQPCFVYSRLVFSDLSKLKWYQGPLELL